MRSLAVLLVVAIASVGSPTGRFTPLGTLPGGGRPTVGGLSDDGRTAIGKSSGGSYGRQVGWRWTRETGMRALEPEGQSSSEVFGVSADGRVFAGMAFPYQAWVYTDVEGFYAIPFNYRHLRCLSGNGVWAFCAGVGNGPPPARWSWETGVIEEPGGTDFHDASFDGLAAAAEMANDVPAYWTSDAGFRPIGTLPGDTYGQAMANSPDGRVVVGFSQGNGIRAFLWTPDAGMRILGDGAASDV